MKQLGFMRIFLSCASYVIKFRRQPSFGKLLMMFVTFKHVQTLNPWLRKQPFYKPCRKTRGVHHSYVDPIVTTISKKEEKIMTRTRSGAKIVGKLELPY